MSSTVAKWENGDTVVRNHKVKIYPTSEQRVILRRWFGTYRFVYNRAVEYAQSPTSSMDLHTLFDKGHCFNFMTMRNIFVTEKGGETSLNTWEFEDSKRRKKFAQVPLRK